jgi:hypothetical protein
MQTGLLSNEKENSPTLIFKIILFIGNLPAILRNPSLHDFGSYFINWEFDELAENGNDGPRYRSGCSSSRTL